MKLNRLNLPFWLGVIGAISIVVCLAVCLFLLNPIIIIESNRAYREHSIADPQQQKIWFEPVWIIQHYFPYACGLGIPAMGLVTILLANRGAKNALRMKREEVMHPWVSAEKVMVFPKVCIVVAVFCSLATWWKLF